MSTDTQSRRLTIRSWLQQLCSDRNIDAVLAEAICNQECSTFDPGASRFEKGWVRRMDEMSDQWLRQHNPHCPALCSYDTERALCCVSWGPMQVLGVVARERGYDGPFLSGLARSLLDALDVGCRQLDYLLTLGKRRGLEGRELLERAVLAYNAGPRSFDWGDPESQSQWQHYVVPVMREYNRLKTMAD